MADNEEKTQIDRIIDNVKAFNKTIDENDDDLLKYSVEAVIDRAKLYLNHRELDKMFERVIADVVSGVFTKYKRNEKATDIEQAVKSMSDNGQSVSYSENIKSYLNAASDNEIFTGFTELLSRYRRIRVVGE